MTGQNEMVIGLQHAPRKQENNWLGRNFREEDVQSRLIGFK
jgi:hypothetical protein